MTTKEATIAGDKLYRVFQYLYFIHRSLEPTAVLQPDGFPGFMWNFVWARLNHVVIPESKINSLVQPEMTSREWHFLCEMTRHSYGLAIADVLHNFIANPQEARFRINPNTIGSMLVVPERYKSHPFFAGIGPDRLREFFTRFLAAYSSGEIAEHELRVP